MNADEQAEKYQGPRPCGFRQEDFFMFALQLANVTPGLGHFGPQCHNLNILGSSLLGTCNGAY